MYSITPVFTDHYSISLDGTDDFIDCDIINNGISDWDDIHEEGSISIWVKVEPTSSTGTIVTLRLNDNNEISLYYHAGSNETRAAWKCDGDGSGGTGSVSTTTASDNPAIEDSGNFHHIVCTWRQAGKIMLYVDGSKLDEKPGGGGRLPEFNVSSGGEIDDIAIGQNTQNSSYFNGNVSNFSLWDVELEASDVSLIYNSGVPNDIMTVSALEPEDKCIAYYKCEADGGTSSTNLVNSSILGFGNDATLTNGADYDRT